MTSKDNLEFILKELCRHLDKSQQDDIIKKAIPIVKDLEVLEILKNKIRISNDLDVRMLDYPLFLLPMRKEERDKIKEWLEYKEK